MPYPSKSKHPTRVVVVGMHRSGTSMLASWLEAMGVDMGRRLLAADQNNRPGYYEDEEFLELNRTMLAAAVPADAPECLPDWGWPGPAGQFDADALRPFAERAAAIVARRDSESGVWGWKDPRTTVALPFWDAALTTNAAAATVYVIIFRAPWDVVASMIAVNPDHRPAPAARVWAGYNRAVLEWRRNHPDRTVMCEAGALVRDPGALPWLLHRRLAALRDLLPHPSVTTAAVVERAAKEIFQDRPATDPAVRAFLAENPETAALLDELRAAADLALPWSPTALR